MPVLKVKENGKWIDIGSNADTLDGKHASEFALKSELGDFLPEVTENNNGQFLRVVNGVATWSSIPNAEEATF